MGFGRRQVSWLPGLPLRAFPTRRRRISGCALRARRGGHPRSQWRVRAGFSPASLGHRPMNAADRTPRGVVPRHRLSAALDGAPSAAPGAHPSAASACAQPGGRRRERARRAAGSAPRARGRRRALDQPRVVERGQVLGDGLAGDRQRRGAARAPWCVRSRSSASTIQRRVGSASAANTGPTARRSSEHLGEAATGALAACRTVQRAPRAGTRACSR